MQPVHLAVGVVAPGAGIVGAGLGLVRIVRRGQLEFLATGTSIISTDGSFLGAAQLTFALPTRGFPERGKSRWSLPESAKLDAKASLTLRASRLEAKEQNFYGLGPDSSRSAHSGYGLRGNDAGLEVNEPLFSWSSVGFSFDFLQPRVDLSTNDSIPQMRAVFTEASAPGLASRNDFSRYEPYLQLRTPPRDYIASMFRAGFAFYHAWEDNTYSFRRLDLTSRTLIPLRLPARRRPVFGAKPVSTGQKIRGFLCPSERSGRYCSLGELTLIGISDFSYTQGSSQVPFYFDETLGGADFEGNDTLRGYADYRFRGPDRLLLQAEYRHPIWGPVGLLSFYDAGKVGFEPSDLSFVGLRHDFGVGLYVRAGGRELARLYLAFGTGEGTRFRPRFGNIY